MFIFAVLINFDIVDKTTMYSKSNFNELIVGFKGETIRDNICFDELLGICQSFPNQTFVLIINYTIFTLYVCSKDFLKNRDKPMSLLQEVRYQ